jgi:hypothetical protein
LVRSWLGSTVRTPPLSKAEDAYLKEVTAAMRVINESLNTYFDLLLSEPWDDDEKAAEERIDAGLRKVLAG